MIVIGVVLALAAVGIAVFILTHMIGDGTSVRRKESAVTAESKKTESKKTESRPAANGGTESQEAGTEAVAPSGDVTAEPTTVPTEPETTAPVTEVITEQYATEEIITNDYSPESNDENELVFEQNDTSGDVPTLEQFLRSMTCGGCRHNCLLVNPRCMKGRAKAESATVEWYETYGA